MEPDAILTRIEDGILTITLNRPQVRNALPAQGWAQLFDILRSAAYDDDVRALVITSAGGAFCSGADISTAQSGHPLTRVRNISRTAEALLTLPKPVVAQVRGAAVGAGMNLALCCDFVVATPDARFSEIFARRGLSLDFGGSWLLPRLVGLQQAKRLAFLGEIILADEAHDLGLVTWLVEDEELDAFVRDLAVRLSAMPPVALAQNKELLQAGLLSSFRDALDNEARAQAINYGTADAATARRAFLEKSEATFTGEWIGS